MPKEFTGDSAGKADVTLGRNRYVNLRSTWRNLSGSDCLGSIVVSTAKVDVTIGRNRLIDFDPRNLSGVSWPKTRGSDCLQSLKDGSLCPHDFARGRPKGLRSSDDLRFSNSIALPMVL